MPRRSAATVVRATISNTTKNLDVALPWAPIIRGRPICNKGPIISLSFPKHLLIIFQTFFRRFKFRKPAAFLFDENIFEAADGLGCGQKFFPWCDAFAEQNTVALFL